VRVCRELDLDEALKNQFVRRPGSQPKLKEKAKSSDDSLKGGESILTSRSPILEGRRITLRIRLNGATMGGGKSALRLGIKGAAHHEGRTWGSRSQADLGSALLRGRDTRGGDQCSAPGLSVASGRIG